MKIKTKMGNDLPKLKGKLVKTKIKGTSIWLIGEQLETKNWNIYVECKEVNRRTKIKENISTETFNIVTNLFNSNLLNLNFTTKSQKITQFSNFLKKLLKTNY